jgi:diguanylate cyclase (GGDEF)-like protein/PAS domain S-box-containing protein
MDPSVTITLPPGGLHAGQAGPPVGRHDGPRPADYRELLSGSPLAFGVVDRLGRLVEVNRAFATLLGSTIARLGRLTVQEVTHPSEPGTLTNALRLAFAGELPSATVDSVLIDESGLPVPVQANLSAVANDQGGYVLLALVDLRLQRERLTNLAFAGTHDPLTGLFNRAGLMAKLEALLAEGRSASLVILDVDKLERVNRSHGHGAGDRLLRHVGAFLAEVAEPDGLASRLTGDEFVVLADTTDEIALARYLSDELARLDVEVAPGVWLPATASVGSAPVRAGLTASQVLAQADASMYDMKQQRQAELDQLNPTG